MHHLLSALFDFCVLGLYRWMGLHIYGSGFADNDNKQPLQKRMLVSAIAFSVTLGIILALVFLIGYVIEFGKFADESRQHG